MIQHDTADVLFKIFICPFSPRETDDTEHLRQLMLHVEKEERGDDLELHEVPGDPESNHDRRSVL